jgi:hypothetical protein
MIKLHSPDNEAELAIIKSIFDAENIQYYVLNDYFGSLKVGPRIHLYNAKIIYVSEEDFENANELLNVFYATINNDNRKFKYSFPDRIRMVLEALIFGWFIPGSRWRADKSKNE